MTVRDKNILLALEKNFDTVHFEYPSRFILTVRDGKQGLYTRDGEELFEPQFDEIDPTFGPLLITVLENKYGLIAPDGKEIFPPVLSNLNPAVFESLVIIEDGPLTGFVSEKGKALFKPTFSNIDLNYVERGYIGVKLRNKWGLIDESGNMRIKPRFDSIYAIEEYDIIIGELNGKKTFYNNDLKEVDDLAFEGLK